MLMYESLRKHNFLAQLNFLPMGMTRYGILLVQIDV